MPSCASRRAGIHSAALFIQRSMRWLWEKQKSSIGPWVIVKVEEIIFPALTDHGNTGAGRQSFTGGAFCLGAVTAIACVGSMKVKKRTFVLADDVQQAAGGRNARGEKCIVRRFAGLPKSVAPSLQGAVDKAQGRIDLFDAIVQQSTRPVPERLGGIDKGRGAMPSRPTGMRWSLIDPISGTVCFRMQIR